MMLAFMMMSDVILPTALLLAGLAVLCSSSHLFQSYINPIILRFFPFSPEYSAFAFFTFAISRSSISCVTFHFAGSASVLPG